MTTTKNTWGDPIDAANNGKPTMDDLYDEAQLALFKLRDRLVMRDDNHGACRVDEVMEKLQDVWEGLKDDALLEN